MGTHGSVSRGVGTQALDAMEAERERIAGEIHDEPVQEIAAASLRLQILRRELHDPGQLEALDALARALDAAMEQLRGLIFELRPPGAGRFEDLLRTYLQEAEHRSGIGHRLEGSFAREPTPQEGLLLYRLAQEALINARKQATGSPVNVTLADRDGDWSVRIARGGESTEVRLPGTEEGT